MPAAGIINGVEQELRLSGVTLTPEVFQGVLRTALEGLSARFSRLFGDGLSTCDLVVCCGDRWRLPSSGIQRMSVKVDSDVGTRSCRDEADVSNSPSEIGGAQDFELVACMAARLGDTHIPTAVPLTADSFRGDLRTPLADAATVVNGCCSNQKM